jgi:site-specific recombinase XerD
VFKDAKRQLMKFSKADKIPFREISYQFITKFDEWFSSRGVALNSIFVYMRALKTLINYAKKEGLIEDSFNPFKDISFSKYRKVQTRKKALAKNKIDAIKALEFEPGDHMHFSKAYFLFSYYCRGINFKDMAYLTWKNISDNCLNYTRKKTGKYYIFRLEIPALQILEQFKSEFTDENSFIFPILSQIHKTTLQQEYRIKKVLKQVNKDLKEIASLINESENLTFYAARHSFATVSKKAGVSISLISEAMGHDSVKTTGIYLDSFEREQLDQAFQNIL